MAFTIEVSLNHLELVTIAWMAFCARSWSVDKRGEPTYTAFMKISEACWPNLTKQERALLRKTLRAVKKIFNQPSIERGMLQGGIDGLMKQLGDDVLGNDDV